ncbi:fasciclin domain-containing protein [Pedobacter duraquae]|uniref:Putative surface protein with fasciclin (FAS1) repeats n=1 Tax=Pedobacter duraquae TaxID=425511 RepID=A0A4R6IF42_9SPHI|nr:fasciclin domain-containing protein [Pedobacter duraquae]TDO20614.1 putative surface protein with fasciclin (FAS1) repeats [Pedobacter duraquae]
MKKQFLTLGLAASLLMFAAACNSNKTDASNADSSTMSTDTSMTTTTTDTTMHTQEGVEVGGALMVPSKNIVENAMGSSDHTTLVAAVKAAGLVETLSGKGPFTVFAPTNAAFAKLPAGAVDNLLKPAMKKDLTNVLTYHVVAGSYKSADLKDGMELTTVQGQKIKLTKKDGAWWVNDAKITIPDVISSNGVTYVIDGVLMPKK